MDAVLAADGDSIVAQAKDGSVLRVCKKNEVDDVPEEPAQEVTDRQRELAQIAQIIADGYSLAHEHARENSAKGYELLAKVLEMMFARLSAIERAYGKMLQEEAAQVQAQHEPDGLDGAIGGILKGMVGGGNGKGNSTTVESAKKE